MNRFERSLLEKINKELVKKEVPFVCYRLKQARFCSQYCDILVDSPLNSYYWAVECKERKKDSLNFKADFSIQKKGHQLEVLLDFSKRAGRIGLIFFKVGRNVFVSKVEDLCKLKEVKKSTSTSDEQWLPLSEFFKLL
jgi:Holliday junction resolvase